MHNDKLAAALALAARGLRVFPLPPNGRRPSAEWKGWPETATTDPEKIRAWWEGTDCNIGVVTTGWLLIDLDMKHGKNGVAAWIELHGGFDTFMVRTPSGGYHLYYSGADVAGSESQLGDGIDVRSHNNYAVGPGSIVDGRAYEVVADEPFAPAPPEIVSRCKLPGQRAENAAVPLVELDTPAAVTAAVERVKAASPAMQGEQSERAYKLANEVKDCGISEAMCNTIMAEWAARCSPPILPHDLAGRVANAYQYGQNPPGAKHPEAMFGTPNIPPPEYVPQPTPEEVHADQAARSRLRLISAAECGDTPHREYVMKGVLSAGQVGCIFGQPGAGKSVLAPHLAYAVAQGRRAFGQRTKAGTVFYVAAEDEAGMQQRVSALRQRHGDAPGFHLVGGVSALVTGNDAVAPDLARLLQLAEEHRPSLIVVDTLAASAAGLDENSSSDMSRIVEAMRSLTRFGAAVVLVHHSPKSGDTPRGHGVLNGAIDMSMIVGPDPDAEDVIRAELRKNRNGTCNLDIAFRIEAAAMGLDGDGDPITAPVCLERTEDEVRSDRKLKLKKGETTALATLQQMTMDLIPANASGEVLFNATRPSVALLDWQERCTSKGVMSNATKPGARNREFNAARNGLVAKNCIYIADGRVTYLGRGNEVDPHRPKPPAWAVNIVRLPPPTYTPADADAASPAPLPN
jgi:archaellum biogenesis ATPase FlaH